MNLGIYAIFTGEYVAFYDKFIESINNFFPNEDKELIILSDALTDKNDTQVGNVHIRVRKFINYHYPYINMNKFQILYEYNKEFEFDHIAYFDSDTIFLEKEAAFWEDLKKDISTEKTIISYHPFYIHNKGQNISDFMQLESAYYNDREFRSYDEKTYINFDYVDSHDCWLITSFFIIPNAILKDVSEKIRIMIQKANREHLHQFKLSDETHYNLLYYFDILNNQEEKYIVKNYIISLFDYDKSYKDVFLCQKYNIEQKSQSKYATKGNLMMIYVDDDFDPDFLYKLYSKYFFNFTFVCISSCSNDILITYVYGRYMFRSKLEFWDEWYNQKNILFNEELYDFYLPDGIGIDHYDKYVFIRKLKEQILNVDFNKLINSDIQYKSDRTIEENKTFNNISYMYYTYDFIKKHCIYTSNGKEKDNT